MLENQNGRITTNALELEDRENGQVNTLVKPIFSEDYSRNMWKAINKAKSKKDLRDALYLVCCRIQELEDKIDKHIKNSV